MARIIILLLFVISIAGCASIEGLRDKSMTTMCTGSGKIGSVAVLPIKESPAVANLSSWLEMYMPLALRENLPGTSVIDSGTLVTRLTAKNLITDYSQWKVTYEATSVIDPKSTAALAHCVNARYFLLVNGIHLARERIRAVDSGYTGWVKNADHVWRTDLKIAVEVIDMEKGKSVWKGVGWAENIDSIARDIDMGLVVQHRGMVPEISKTALPMARTAANGIAAELRKAQDGSPFIQSENQKSQ